MVARLTAGAPRVASPWVHPASCQCSGSMQYGPSRSRQTHARAWCTGSSPVAAVINADGGGDRLDLAVGGKTGLVRDHDCRHLPLVECRRTSDTWCAVKGPA